VYTSLRSEAEAYAELERFEKASNGLNGLLAQLYSFFAEARYRRQTVQQQQQQQEADAEEGPRTSEPVCKLDVGDLVVLMKEARSLDDSQAVEAALRLSFEAHPSPEVRRRLEAGQLAMSRCDWEVMRAEFEAVLGLDPTYYEARNRLATGLYLKGSQQLEYSPVLDSDADDAGGADSDHRVRVLDEALRETKQVLAVEPYHFGALSGVTMCHSQLQALAGTVPPTPEEVLEALESSARVHPWSAQWWRIHRMRQAMPSQEKGVEP